MLEPRKIKRILVLNLADKSSRDFVESLSGEEYASFHDIIDWYNPAHLPRVEEYLLDKHYPSLSKFPSCWVFLPREHTFAEEDQVALISGFTTYQEIINEGDWAKVEAIIEAVQMSESYKVQYIKSQILLNSAIPAQLLNYFMTCTTVSELKAMHYRLLESGMFVKDEALISNVLEETKVDLGEVITLNSPREMVPLPQGFGENKLKMLVLDNG